MKLFKIVLSVLAVSCFCQSCAQIEKSVPLWKMTPDERLFESAERQYQEKSYAEALSLYMDYMKKYPDNPSAPEALYKMGLINLELKKYGDAQKLFQRVISAYPKRPFMQKAGVEMLSTFFIQGKYQEVTIHAGNS